jgi:hypothetical protein
MEQALNESTVHGKQRTARPVVCPWNEYIPPVAEWGGGTAYQPTILEPLVFHLFGDFDSAETDGRSFVLTEDDYFDFLFGFGRVTPTLPTSVLRGLTDNALLFLGFRVDSWSFRVLLRSIVNLTFGERRKRPQRPHVAVQVDPADPAYRDPAGAREYLAKYLGLADISIYEGPVDEMLSELERQLHA